MFIELLLCPRHSTGLGPALVKQRGHGHTALRMGIPTSCTSGPGSNPGEAGLALGIACTQRQEQQQLVVLATLPGLDCDGGKGGVEQVLPGHFQHKSPGPGPFPRPG